MAKILFILGVSVGSVLLGYLVRRVRVAGRSLDEGAAAVWSRRMKIAAIFVLNPVPVIDSFWKLSLQTRGILLLPLLGVLSLLIGGAAAVALSRIFRIPPNRAASVFTCGMFTNIVSFGGLIAFVFYGTVGYALVQLFNMLVSSSYYVVGFPLSRRISLGPRRRDQPSPPGPFREQPYLFVPIAALAAGIVLNLLHVPRPAPLDTASNILIPSLAGMLGFSIGLTLFVSRIGTYRKEIPLVMLIKFVIVPGIMIPLGALLGLPGAGDGTAFKVLVILSVMPVAFNALVPPALYGFDLDLANSAWITTTLALVVIIPALYLILQP
ncbi:AEC family transporter [Salinispira pacifica]